MSTSNQQQKEQQQQQQPSEYVATPPSIGGGKQSPLLEKNSTDNWDDEQHEEDTKSSVTFKERVHNAVGNAREFAGGARDALGGCKENLIAQTKDLVSEVREVGYQELQEADNNELPMLDMALTFNLSILPNDVAQVAAALEQEDGAEATVLLDANQDTDMSRGESLSKPASATRPLFAYVVLALAVLGLSSIGPFLNLQQDAPALLKVIWRQNGTVLLLLPFLYKDIQQNGLPRLTCPQWTNFVMCSAAYASANICFVQSLEYTTVGNAVIFANSQAIMLLLGKLLIGTPISLLEALGATIAFSGAILCAKDGMSVEESEEGVNPSMAILGDVIAAGAGLSGVLYLLFAQTSRLHFSLLMLMFLTMVLSTMFIILVQMLVLEETVTFGMDPFSGIWGFLSIGRFDRLLLECINVLVCNVLGAFGYVLAMAWFDSLVIAVAGLLQPVVATFTAFFIGVGALPGPMGWVGNVLVAAGTYAVVYKSPTTDDKKEEVARVENLNVTKV